MPTNKALVSQRLARTGYGPKQLSFDLGPGGVGLAGGYHGVDKRHASHTVLDLRIVESEGIRFLAFQ